MKACAAVPPVAWSRRLDQVLDRPGRPMGVSLRTFFELLPAIMRIQYLGRRARKGGVPPPLGVARPLNPGPDMGVPLGGIGGGTITRGWEGGFVRWQMRPGLYRYGLVPADQFAVYAARPGAAPQARVLYPGRPAGNALAAWTWDMPRAVATYHALYPRAWTVYEQPLPGLRLTCRQISPIIPHNYRESSIPAGVFAWTIENTGEEPATVALLFAFQNGTGAANDLSGGHANEPFTLQADGGPVTGILLHHVHRQPAPPGTSAGAARAAGGRSKALATAYEDRLTFAIAAQAQEGVAISYCPRFETTGSGAEVWGDFAGDGRLSCGEDARPAAAQMAIGGAVCATVEVPPGGARTVSFALAWDMPVARFGSGRGYYRRYTRFFGRAGTAAAQIACAALEDQWRWEALIEAWQAPVLADPRLPDWYKALLFNETYCIADGGTVWTDGEEGGERPAEQDIGHFAYLEGHEYLMYNTYDVHFYASFALAMLWPELELSVQRDFAAAVPLSQPELRPVTFTGRPAPRKTAGAVPHDLGGPLEDPWREVNAYNFQDVSRWKDLNAKFVLQVYRDYVLTGRRSFLDQTWPAVTEAMAYLARFDRDGDGLIENDGYPDQTYDAWTVRGPSAYSGGLWLAALEAAAAIADVLGQVGPAAGYRAGLARGQAAYEQRLWTGAYYAYDAGGSRQSASIMADQLAGDWYARACCLPPIVPKEHARRALKTIYDYNVVRFAHGRLGAVNGMRRDGRVDTTSLQSQEVWTGTTCALAAEMLQLGLDDEAFATAHGVYIGSYEELGTWFMTPEAWTVNGRYRSLAYMRPLAIWAVQWAWERRAPGRAVEWPPAG